MEIETNINIYKYYSILFSNSSTVVVIGYKINRKNIGFIQFMIVPIYYKGEKKYHLKSEYSIKKGAWYKYYFSEDEVYDNFVDACSRLNSIVKG